MEEFGGATRKEVRPEGLLLRAVDELGDEVMSQWRNYSTASKLAWGWTGL